MATAKVRVKVVMATAKVGVKVVMATPRLPGNIHRVASESAG